MYIDIHIYINHVYINYNQSLQPLMKFDTLAFVVNAFVGCFRLILGTEACISWFASINAFPSPVYILIAGFFALRFLFNFHLFTFCSLVCFFSFIFYFIFICSAVHWWEFHTFTSPWKEFTTKTKVNIFLN